MGLNMARRSSVLGAFVSTVPAVGVFGAWPAYGAAANTKLLLSQGDAFAVLGHSCGGIQEKVYATGFAADGHPTGNVYLSTSCGGSGRGGGYTSTTYAAWAAVTWDWLGETRSYGALQGAAEANPTFSAEDAHHDRVYNNNGAAFLETTEPPLAPPAAPTSVSAYVSVVEVGENAEARFQLAWTPDPKTAGLIVSSKVVATPVGSPEPALEATVEGLRSAAVLAPLARHTTYRITVTITDLEGTSAPSAPIEVNSITPEESAERKAEEPPVEKKAEEPPVEKKAEEPPVEKKEEPSTKPLEPGGCTSTQAGSVATPACDGAGTTQSGNRESTPSPVEQSSTVSAPADSSAPQAASKVPGARGRAAHKHRHRIKRHRRSRARRR
jgi:hypothetical protein